jgi:hypothetical protein
MRIQEVVPDRRPVGYAATPVTVVDLTGREIAAFRSPGKLAKVSSPASYSSSPATPSSSGKPPWWCRDTVLLQRLRHGNRHDV